VERHLSGREGPVVAATDYMRALPDGIRPFVPAPYHVLGTDGFGRSDRRARLRTFFEVDRTHIAVAALAALSTAGVVEPATVAQAIARHGIDPEAAPPWQR
jgi:pyruvate dehydrogenase E1 component